MNQQGLYITKLQDMFQNMYKYLIKTSPKLPEQPEKQRLIIIIY